MITGGETIRAFVRALGPIGFAMYDNLSVISANIVEEMVARVKSCIDLEISKEGRRIRKPLKKRFKGGKKHEQCISKVGHDDKHRSLNQRPSREVYETFMPPNREISMILIKMKRKDLETPPALRKNDAPMGNEVNQYCRYHRWKGHSTVIVRSCRRTFKASSKEAT